jgi:hypothetical protein
MIKRGKYISYFFLTRTENNPWHTGRRRGGGGGGVVELRKYLEKNDLIDVWRARNQ